MAILCLVGENQLCFFYRVMASTKCPLRSKYWYYSFGYNNINAATICRNQKNRMTFNTSLNLLMFLIEDFDEFLKSSNHVGDIYYYMTAHIWHKNEINAITTCHDQKIIRLFSYFLKFISILDWVLWLLFEISSECGDAYYYMTAHTYRWH